MIREYLGPVKDLTGVMRDEKSTSGFHLILAVSTGAPRVTLPTNELHLERLLEGDNRFWRKRGELHLQTEEQKSTWLHLKSHAVTL